MWDIERSSTAFSYTLYTCLTMKLLLLTLLLGTSTLAFAQAPATFTLKDAKALADADTKLFYAGDTSPLWDAMSDAMKKGLKDPAGLQDVQHKITAQLGKETAVLHESAIILPPQMFNVVRIVEFDKIMGSIVVTWTFSADGKTIEGFYIRPEANPAPTKFADYKDKTALTLPLTGAWTVYQGGTTVGENYHAASIDQRFAYDLSLVKDGALFSGTGSKSEDFYGFGQPVLAPAAGKIVVADDLYQDNAPGKGSDDDPPQGNAIVIDHGNGEFSMLAHLKSGSLKVKVGDTVKAGQPIALVGQSGNSPIPHLHYHLQTTAVFQKGQGLPIQFTHLLVNGKPTPAATPVRGDIIENK
jgi:hypothetical protein